MMFKPIRCILSHNLHKPGYSIICSKANIHTTSNKGNQNVEESVSTSPTNSAPTPDGELLFRRTFEKLQPYFKPREAWVLNMNSIEENQVSLMQLHPEVFGARIRFDLMKECVQWQEKYRQVSYANSKARHEVERSSKKPWPQKGTGRARAGDRRSHIFKGGCQLHGPRSPTPSFYMMDYFQRVLGLCSTLTVKLAQDDLHVVDNLEIPTENSKYISDLVDTRNWGPSVLFVDVVDIFPKNITIATDTIGHLNLLPVYGLNVYSMLKHDTLVLTIDAVKKLEEKLIAALYSCDYNDKRGKFKLSRV